MSGIRFYLNYIFHKLILLTFEVKSPRMRFYLYELIYSVLKAFNRKVMFVYPFKDELIVTKYGKFFIRPKTTDAVVVSPAYEYLDRSKLVKLVDKNIKSGKKVLFVDIGANIGCYSVYLGNKFLMNNLTILSIEASSLNYELLIKNIQLNNLNDLIKPFNCALWDEDDLDLELFYNEKLPGCSFVGKNREHGNSNLIKSKTLDSLLKDYLNTAEVLIIKIDVEGAEEKILRGGKKVLNMFDEVYIIVESFDDEKTISLLKEFEFKNFSRLTPYNLWAYKDKRHFYK